MGRRTLLLIASILVAAVGTALIGLYVRGADNRAHKDVTQRNVLVATADITAGTAPAKSRYSLQPRTSGELPPGYLTSADQIEGKAVNTILSGTILQKRMFAVSGAAPVTNDVSKGSRGAAFDLGDPQRVAGLLTPGSWVTIYATSKTQGSPHTIAMFDGNPVKVIAIGSQSLSAPQATAGAAKDTDVPRAVVTLDLRPEQARSLIETDATDELAFGLLSAADAPAAKP
jgi:pilus assembly protein CpaB